MRIAERGVTVNPFEIVVLGLGNVLHSDDGVGPRALERLRSDPRVPDGVTLLEGGTLGLELLTYVWDCAFLLVLDAVDVGRVPGTIVRIEGEGLNSLPGKGSVHQLGLADLMVALRVLADKTPEVVVLGVQPATTAWGAELSPAVDAVMDSFLDAAVVELRSRVQTAASASR